MLCLSNTICCNVMKSTILRPPYCSIYFVLSPRRCLLLEICLHNTVVGERAKWKGNQTGISVKQRVVNLYVGKFLMKIKVSSLHRAI